MFSPRGVAVVGVSLKADYSFARDLIQALIEAEFPAIYPVNPKYNEVLGLPCYPDLKSIPGVVDHVSVSIPADRILDLLDDCAAKGVNSVHLYTAGFSEGEDPERSKLEQLILKKARQGDFRIIGPNCTGMFVAKKHLPIAPRTPMEPGPIALLSQSGGHATDLAILGGPRGLRFSKIVSYGNGLDIDECDLLEYFSHDPDTEIIAAYIEGLKDGKRFYKILKEVTTHKPVIIYKGGITEAGLRATFSHTASITSSVVVFDAVCRLLNVIQVNDTEELTDVLVLLFNHAVPQGIGVAVVGAGGGPSVLASDVMERAGLKLPPLPAEIVAELKQLLPVEGGIFVNPVDALNLTFPEAIQATLNILGKVNDIDMVIYHLGFHPLSRWSD